MRFKNRIRKAFSENSRDETLHDRGLDGTAVITSVKKSLVSAGGDEGSSDAIYKYELRVTVSGRDPYDVSHSETGRGETGETVPVKVDPDDPENLLIDWGTARAAAAAERQQAVDANVAAVETMFSPASLAADDAALEPIEGITLERYAELAAARMKQGIATEEQQDEWLATQGVAPEAWKTASEGWGQRMAAKPAIAMQYATLFQRASA